MKVLTICGSENSFKLSQVKIFRLGKPCSNLREINLTKST